MKRAIIFYNLKAQLTIVSPKVYTYLVVLFMLSTSLPKSESTKPFNFTPVPLKQCVLFVVPLKYLMIHFTIYQRCLPGLLMYLLTTPTTCVMSDLVQTIAYIRLLGYQ